MYVDIQVETTAMFFLYRTVIKSGYWLGVCHAWFHLHWLTRAAMSGKIELQKKSSGPYTHQTTDSNTPQWYVKPVMDSERKFCPALDPPLGGSDRKTTTLVRDHEHFIPTKFHQNPRYLELSLLYMERRSRIWRYPQLFIYLKISLIHMKIYSNKWRHLQLF